MNHLTIFISGINVAATFSRDLMRQNGAALGAEYRGKGIHVGLAPMMFVEQIISRNHSLISITGTCTECPPAEEIGKGMQPI
jgi:hypothetical protein